MNFVLNGLRGLVMLERFQKMWEEKRNGEV